MYAYIIIINYCISPTTSVKIKISIKTNFNYYLYLEIFILN